MKHANYAHGLLGNIYKTNVVVMGTNAHTHPTQTLFPHFNHLEIYLYILSYTSIGTNDNF